MKKVGVKDIAKEAGRCSGCRKMGPIVIGLGNQKYCAGCKHLAAPSPKPSTRVVDERRGRRWKIGEEKNESEESEARRI